MSVNLKKGQKINLTKDNAELSEITVGFGWDTAKLPIGFTRTKPIECRASAFALKDGKLTSNEDIVYFANLAHKSGAISHKGLELTDADGKEIQEIEIDLQKLPNDYDGVIFALNIFDAFARNQSFAVVQSAFIRVVDISTGKEICRYNLAEDISGMTALIFAKLLRDGGEWKFAAVGTGTRDGKVAEIAARYA